MWWTSTRPGHVHYKELLLHRLGEWPLLLGWPWDRGSLSQFPKSGMITCMHMWACVLIPLTYQRACASTVFVCCRHWQRTWSSLWILTAHYQSWYCANCCDVCVISLVQVDSCFHQCWYALPSHYYNFSTFSGIGNIGQLYHSTHCITVMSLKVII